MANLDDNFPTTDVAGASDAPFKSGERSARHVVGPHRPLLRLPQNIRKWRRHDGPIENELGRQSTAFSGSVATSRGPYAAETGRDPPLGKDMSISQASTVDAIGLSDYGGDVQLIYKFVEITWQFANLVRSRR